MTTAKRAPPKYGESREALAGPQLSNRSGLDNHSNNNVPITTGRRGEAVPIGLITKALMQRLQVAL